MVTDVSKNLDPSTLWRRDLLGLLDPEDEGITIPRNVGN